MQVVEMIITPNLPTKITPTKIAWLRLSGKFPMGLGIPPGKLKIVLESNPLKSTMLARGLAADRPTPGLHHKILHHKIFARVCVAQEPICS